MPARSMRRSGIRVHFAFADITADWEVSIQYMDQFNKFKALKNIKRIVAFGGWAFSTEVATYARFREGVQEANREVLATKIVAFVKQHGLDGVDFDWEYPGAGVSVLYLQ